ncbi:hypothetical protein RFI_08938 [Reticulomyxa filosa]|uniref:Uncharacterized protein n=1 Tax=Reticulomyxa filosa TaxID=46433 RepID=X6NS73_RETFI|nr:hypothetical protein RFI_08938 [Reticulomyxa filosa]|eukprot:ETO28192.1 hypothetical protein RFI_08938 [Reticulomyxa filosa]
MLTASFSMMFHLHSQVKIKLFVKHQTLSLRSNKQSRTKHTENFKNLNTHKTPKKQLNTFLYSLQLFGKEKKKTKNKNKSTNSQKRRTTHNQYYFLTLFLLHLSQQRTNVTPKNYKENNNPKSKQILADQTPSVNPNPIKEKQQEKPPSQMFITLFYFVLYCLFY